MFENKRIYLDNAATTAVDLSVLKAMIPYMNEKFGNSSSTHHYGEEAKMAQEESREIIAKSINAKQKEIIFTSGGTESNNFALKGLFFSNKDSGKKHIITTKIEHDCVLNSCKWLEKQGARITFLSVDKNGFVNLEELKKSIEKDTLAVSIIHGNNEIGTIQDLEAIGKICNEKEIYFHSDACQSYMKVPIDVKKMNLDLLTLNAHKIHGPKGIGALFVREGVKIEPLLHGGGHEFGKRSGTVNISGVVGFAEAVKISSGKDIK
ncbi:MAG: cysteine desulfurase family protein, partial [Nanoarchaeota archaeon]